MGFRFRLIRAASAGCRKPWPSERPDAGSRLFRHGREERRRSAAPLPGRSGTTWSRASCDVVPASTDRRSAGKQQSAIAAPLRPFHKSGAGCTACPRCWRSRTTAISSSYPIEHTPTSGCICSSTPTTDGHPIPTALPSPARAVVLDLRQRHAVGARPFHKRAAGWVARSRWWQTRRTAISSP
jgi:hypothetical protein